MGGATAPAVEFTPDIPGSAWRALAALGNAQRVFALEARAPPVFGLQRAAHLRHKRQRVARARKCAAHPAYLCGKRVHNLGLKQKHLYGFCALPQCVQALGSFIVFVEFWPNGAIPLFHQLGCHG
ncbi:MAG: hypothetical protein ACLRPX_03905, partial [Ruthenibacterium sp.]